MSKRYELSIGILNEAYLDSLITALVHQGYAPYIADVPGPTTVCIEVSSAELTELKVGK